MRGTGAQQSQLQVPHNAGHTRSAPLSQSTVALNVLQSGTSGVPLQVAVGDLEGALVGARVVGILVGSRVGKEDDGTALGIEDDGAAVGTDWVGARVGARVGDKVGDKVGLGVSGHVRHSR